MKTNLVMLLAFTLSGNAFAKCAEQNLEGTYLNGRKDKFKIEQPDCDTLIVIDETNKTHYKTDLKDKQNWLEVSAPEPSILSTITHLIPVAYSVDRSKWEQGITTVAFETQLNIRDTDAYLGIKPPIIRYTAEIYGLDTVNPNAKETYGISIRFISLQAVEDPESSAIQKAFIRGLNLGLSYFSHLIDYRGKIGEFLINEKVDR